jgi:MFS family permease
MTLICMDETSTTHYTRIYHFLSEEEKTLSLLPSTTEDNHIKSTLSTTSKTAIVIKAILSPFQLLVHPVFITTALLSATFYTIQIYLYTDIPATYSTIYFFSPSETGLVFLGIGIGMTLGLLAFGLFSDRIMTTLAGAGKRQARHRLPLMCVYAMLVAVGLVVFAVSARQGVFWLVPVIGNAITGAGLYSFSVCPFTSHRNRPEIYWLTSISLGGCCNVSH